MKRLTKQSLDELAKTMSVISRSELNRVVGMYTNDCFWRCIAYVDSSGISYSESDAEAYAHGYYESYYGSNTSSTLSNNGSGMNYSQINEYKTMMVSSGNYGFHETDYIIVFNTNNINFYSNTNTNHAVVVKSVNQDGSLNVFDPQLGTSFNISAGEVGNTSRAFY